MNDHLIHLLSLSILLDPLTDIFGFERMRTGFDGQASGLSTSLVMSRVNSRNCSGISEWATTDIVIDQRMMHFEMLHDGGLPEDKFFFVGFGAITMVIFRKKICSPF